MSAASATIMNELKPQDYVDAAERLARLKLSDKVDREVSRVIIHCCMQVRASDWLLPFRGIECFGDRSKSTIPSTQCWPTTCARPHTRTA